MHLLGILQNRLHVINHQAIIDPGRSGPRRLDLFDIFPLLLKLFDLLVTIGKRRPRADENRYESISLPKPL